MKDMKKHIPINGLVLVQQHEAQKKMGAIDIPEIEQRKPNSGTVIRACDTVRLNPGDQIIFDKFSGFTEVKEDGKDYLLIEYKNIKSIIDEK